ncbi:MAG TPA: hypothetical protein VG890_10475 [Puia sp.]|nr:hypothetical protein [Puia sp.]
MAGKLRYGLPLALLLPGFALAQQVSYSPYINQRAPDDFEVIGRSGNYYWVEKEQIRKAYRQHETDYDLKKQSFIAYDERLNPVKEIVAPDRKGIIKEYLVAGKDHFDQLVLSAVDGGTGIFVNRYSAGTDNDYLSMSVDRLPFTVNPSGVLLIRSADLSRVLLLAFEPGEMPEQRLHTILFNADWKMIYHTVIEHPYFSQPCIQDDDIAFPGESFDNLPVKLANDGSWFMASPSRTNRNFLFFHIGPNGTNIEYREIPLSPGYTMEDIAMSIDNEQQSMSVGLLSGYRHTTLKSVAVTRYSMTNDRFEFDSCYHFNSLAGRLKNQNLSNAAFMAISDEGYMLLKEYGRPVDASLEQTTDLEPGDPVYFMAAFSEQQAIATRHDYNDYAYRNGLQGVQSIFNRGNLSMYYFPVNRSDSSWSGTINTEQTTELNNPALSYLVFPVHRKIFFIYNSPLTRSGETSTTTTLDRRGQPTGDALIFWKLNRTMDFQQARRISAGEVAVPFHNGGQRGFAILRLMVDIQ